MRYNNLILLSEEFPFGNINRYGIDSIYCLLFGGKILYCRR